MSGPNPLSFESVRDYALEVGYTASEDIFFLAEVMSACDQVYLEDYQKRSKAESAAKKSSGSKGRGRK